MIFLEDELVMLKLLKCEVDNLLRVVYLVEDSSDAYRLNYVRKQFDCVCDVLDDIKRTQFFSS